MGIDKFTNFICKSLNNNSYEELYMQDNIRKIISSHIIFDINFLIYQELIEIENEINDIIKIILCLPFCVDNIEKIKNLLRDYFKQSHWKYYSEEKSTNLINSLNYEFNTEDTIINQFIQDLNQTINLNSIEEQENDEKEQENDNILNENNVMKKKHKIEDLNNQGNILLIELIIYNKISNTIIENINKFHLIELIQYISIFFDGIPSISKVIEQRRRRIKNYLESNKKKCLYKSLFDNLSNNNNSRFKNHEDLYFDYLKWFNKYKFIVDKSLGPASNFIINCEKIIENNLKNHFPKMKIYIDSSNINGESDLKIFKYINKDPGDYTIHTIDSDLIHLMLIQEVFYKLLNLDININILKYNSSYNKYNSIQILDGNLIIKNILNLYNSINNTKTNNYKIIWDLCIIFLSFGNDHLPSSIEIGPELGLEFYLKTHYQALNKNNIISIDTSENISINLNNLCLYYSKINETRKQNMTKIILQRYFKINIHVINLLVYKLELDFNEILLYLQKFIIYKAKLLTNEELLNLDEDDLRRKFLLNSNNTVDQNIDFKVEQNMDFTVNQNIDFTPDIIKLLDDNIDYLESEYNGLIIYNKPYNITNDNYQDIYNYIIDKSVTILSKQYPIFYNYNDIKDHLKQLNPDVINNINSEEYLKNIYHLILTQFGSMKNLHSDNITFYKEYYVPSLNNIIKYMKDIEYNKINMWNSELSNNNLNKNEYLNSCYHHILISPFVNNKSLLLQNINFDNIKNLWIEDINDFEYRNINIKEYFEYCYKI